MVVLQHHHRLYFLSPPKKKKERKKHKSPPTLTLPRSLPPAGHHHHLFLLSLFCLTLTSVTLFTPLICTHSTFLHIPSFYTQNFQFTTNKFHFFLCRRSQNKNKNKNRARHLHLLQLHRGPHRRLPRARRHQNPTQLDHNFIPLLLHLHLQTVVVQKKSRLTLANGRSPPSPSIPSTAHHL